MQGVAERNHLGQAGLAQVGNHAQQSRRQFPAFLVVEVLFREQIAELLLEAIDPFQGGVERQIRRELLMLSRAEIVAVAAHQRKQAAILGTHRIQILPPASQEVVLDDADHVETIGHDACLPEVLSHHRPIRHGQVHAHHLYQVLALKLIQIALQRGFAATGDKRLDNKRVWRIYQEAGLAVKRKSASAWSAKDDRGKQRQRAMKNGPWTSFPT